MNAPKPYNIGGLPTTFAIRGDDRWDITISGGNDASRTYVANLIAQLCERKGEHGLSTTDGRGKIILELDAHYENDDETAPPVERRLKAAQVQKLLTDLQTQLSTPEVLAEYMRLAALTERSQQQQRDAQLASLVATPYAVAALNFLKQQKITLTPSQITDLVETMRDAASEQLQRG